MNEQMIEIANDIIPDMREMRSDGHTDEMIRDSIESDLGQVYIDEIQDMVEVSEFQDSEEIRRTITKYIMEKI